MVTITTKYPFVGSIETRQGGRSENQDNAGFIDTPMGLLLVVCDGMGGGPSGRTASLMAVDTVLTLLSDVSEHTRRDDALCFAIEKANDAIYAKALENPEQRGMGTTIAAVLINETSAIIAHVGDTRIYLLRKGAIAYRSADHSFVANLVRQKKITEEQARNHPRSNVITRALGIRPTVEIEFDEVSFQTGDRFVICTDGIWGMMPQPDLVKFLSHVMGISELTISVAEEIDRMGQENGGGHDNLTLIVLDTTFDSSLKGSKKSTKAQLSSFTKGIRVNKKWCLYAFAFILTLSLTVLLYMFLNKNAVTDTEQKDLKNREGSVIAPEPTTIPPPESNDEELDVQGTTYTPESTSDDIRNVEEQLKLHNSEIKRQILEVVSELNHLKDIKGNDKPDAERKKRRYVNITIKPDVNHLGEKVSHKKKEEVKNILKMLNDKKTVLSSRKGQPTKDGNEHIEHIKRRVIKLQN